MFTSANSEDIQAMKTAYESLKGKSLNDVIRSELGGEHEKLILFLLAHGRPEDPADEAKVLTTLYINQTTEASTFINSHMYCLFVTVRDTLLFLLYCL